MKRTLAKIKIEDYPARYHPLLRDALVYDSSCSPDARVLFIEKEEGYYLKTAEKGALENEAILDRYFHKNGMGPEVLNYFSADQDWLLTARIPGEDCTHPLYLSDPKRLCREGAPVEGLWLSNLLLFFVDTKKVSLLRIKMSVCRAC